MSNTRKDNSILEAMETQLNDSKLPELFFKLEENDEKALEESVGKGIFIPNDDAPDAPQPANPKVKRIVYGGAATLTITLVISGFVAALSHGIFG